MVGPVMTDFDTGQQYPSPTPFLPGSLPSLQLRRGSPNQARRQSPQEVQQGNAEELKDGTAQDDRDFVSLLSEVDWPALPTLSFAFVVSVAYLFPPFSCAPESSIRAFAIETLLALHFLVSAVLQLPLKIFSVLLFQDVLSDAWCMSILLLIYLTLLGPSQRGTPNGWLSNFPIIVFGFGLVRELHSSIKVYYGWSSSELNSGINVLIAAISLLSPTASPISWLAQNLCVHSRQAADYIFFVVRVIIGALLTISREKLESTDQTKAKSSAMQVQVLNYLFRTFLAPLLKLQSVPLPSPIVVEPLLGAALVWTSRNCALTIIEFGRLPGILDIIYTLLIIGFVWRFFEAATDLGKSSPATPVDPSGTSQTKELFAPIISSPPPVHRDPSFLRRLEQRLSRDESRGNAEYQKLDDQPYAPSGTAMGLPRTAAGVERLANGALPLTDIPVTNQEVARNFVPYKGGNISTSVSLPSSAIQGISTVTVNYIPKNIVFKQYVSEDRLNRWADQLGKLLGYTLEAFLAEIQIQRMFMIGLGLPHLSPDIEQGSVRNIVFRGPKRECLQGLPSDLAPSQWEEIGRILAFEEPRDLHDFIKHIKRLFNGVLPDLVRRRLSLEFLYNMKPYSEVPKSQFRQYLNKRLEDILNSRLYISDSEGILEDTNSTMYSESSKQKMPTDVEIMVHTFLTRCDLTFDTHPEKLSFSRFAFAKVDKLQPVPKPEKRLQVVTKDNVNYYVISGNDALTLSPGHRNWKLAFALYIYLIKCTRGGMIGSMNINAIPGLRDLVDVPLKVIND